MPISKIIVFLSALLLSNLVWAQATNHGGHGGDSSSGGGGDETSCIKAKISRYNPEHLATVAPGSEFSFAVSGSNGPGHIHVSIRQQPIQINLQDKETFYLVKGKLPAEIKNETVRISVKVKAKFSKCDADGGLLFKVIE